MNQVRERHRAFSSRWAGGTILALLALLLLAACGSGLPDTGGTPAAGTAAAAPAQTEPPEQVEAAPTQTEAGPAQTEAGPATDPQEPAQTQALETAAPQAEELPPLNCSSPAPLTPAMTEGPYYKPDAPERTSLLEPGMEGTRLVITGYVLTRDCQPIPGAWLDFWQTDAKGEYDNAGYRLRGHQFSDQNGRYRLETVIPGEYPGRTAHIHLKVQAPGGPVLTSQLFFPGAAGNQTDIIFAQELVLPLQDTADGKTAVFNFVVEN